MSSIDAITGTNATDYNVYEAAANAVSGSGDGFSSVFADVMKGEMTRMSVTAGAGTSGLAGGYMPMQMQSQGLEEMILAAASSGETNDAQVALMMLCMMMQSSQDSDFAMPMQMMAALIAQLQDGGSLRGTVMKSGYDPYVLDTIDWNVFKTPMPGLSKTGQAVLPLEFWRPTTPAVTSSEDNRSPELYSEVIRQFRVETAERYKPFRDGNTYCNIFMWDVTCAMGAEIPHYTNPDTGEPAYYPDVQGAQSMTAVMIDEWLKKYGEACGWRQVDAETAQRYANEGKPAVATGGSLDHVQVVCPSKDGEFDPIRGVTIAQAGSIVTSYTHISGIYSANALSKVSYFVHE